MNNVAVGTSGTINGSPDTDSCAWSTWICGRAAYPYFAKTVPVATKKLNSTLPSSQ